MDATKDSNFEYLGGEWRPKSDEARSRAPVGGSMGKAYRLTVLQQRIDKIEQKLFWYDNLPEDDVVVKYIKDWRACLREMKALNKRIV